MATSERKRQEKLARKAAKRKQHLQSLRASAAQPVSLQSALAQIERSEGAPVYECLVPQNLFGLGVGNVIFSRSVGGGMIVVAAFLLDVYCLGAKDALLRLASESEYQVLLDGFAQLAPYQDISPECARKLVEAAVAYAEDLGFHPHADYELAHRIFGSVDPEACRMSFEFGKDGKPFYVSGPNDTPAKSRRIMQTLTERCGPDGFVYLVELDSLEGF